MSTPLSFCDISARYGQTPAAQKTIEEQTGWNPKQLFLDYMQKLREQKKENAKQDKEDALMAMVDAMNAPKEDREAGKTDMVGPNSLRKASKAIIEQYEGKVNPMQTLEVQVLLSCLGDRFVYEEMDEVQENQQQAQEQQTREEHLEVTEARDPSDPSNPNDIERR